MTRLPYCPACRKPLDDNDRCWSVCALAGIAQPAIHFAEFEEDEYEMRNGYGEVVTRYTRYTFIKDAA